MTAPARPALRYPFALLGLVCFFCTFLADGTTESGFSAEAPVLFGLLCLTGAAVGAFLLPGVCLFPPYLPRRRSDFWRCFPAEIPACCWRPLCSFYRRRGCRSG